MLYPLISAASLEQHRVEFLDFMEQVCGFCEPYEVKSFIFYCSFITFQPVQTCISLVGPTLIFLPIALKFHHLLHGVQKLRAEQASVPAANDLKPSVKGLH